MKDEKRLVKKKGFKYYFVSAIICWLVVLASLLFLDGIPIMFLLGTTVITIDAFVIDNLKKQVSDLKVDFISMLDNKEEDGKK